MKTFLEWLKEQGENDYFGDLAKDVLNDDCLPQRNPRFEDIYSHMMVNHKATSGYAEDLFDAFYSWCVLYAADNSSLENA